ncbi:hypothetical protein [Paenibacillus sp. FSL R7-277]|nr:hypothetical protein [Paenibacillus sp. FSL R7-277]
MDDAGWSTLMYITDWQHRLVDAVVQYRLATQVSDGDAVSIFL